MEVAVEVVGGIEMVGGDATGSGEAVLIWGVPGVGVDGSEEILDD